jgi:hypothetical protein
LGELLADQLNRPGEAMREFERVITKSTGKSGYAAGGNNNGSSTSAYQKYEFSDFLRRRAALALDQLRNRQHHP